MHDLLIDLVEAVAIDFQQIERRCGDGLRDVAFCSNLRVIADAAEQAVGDARRAAAAAGDLFGAPSIDLHVEQPARNEERWLLSSSTS